LRGQRSRGRDRPCSRRARRNRARLGPSAGRRHAAQVLAAGVGAARGSRLLRPRGPGDPQVAATAAGRPAGGLRHELPQVRRRRARRTGGGVADARAPHRAAEARRRHGRARARVPEPDRVSALSSARRGFHGRDPAAHADRGRPGRAGRRRLARRAGGEDELLGGVQEARRVVVRAPAVLSPAARATTFLALAAAVGSYYAWSSSLWNASTWWDVAWISLVLVPAVFGFV